MKQYPVYWNDSNKMDRFTCGFIFAEAGRWAGEYFTVVFTPLGDGPLRVNRELANKILKFDGEDAKML